MANWWKNFLCLAWYLFEYMMLIIMALFHSEGKSSFRSQFMENGCKDALFSSAFVYVCLLSALCWFMVTKKEEGEGEGGIARKKRTQLRWKFKIFALQILVYLYLHSDATMEYFQVYWLNTSNRLWNTKSNWQNSESLHT